MTIEITRMAIAAISPQADARARVVMTSLLQHLHDFARDVNLTIPEMFAGLGLLKRAGDMTDDRRHELLLCADVLGFESLVDALSFGAAGGTTESAVLGPFYRDNAPVLEKGDSVIQGEIDGPLVLVAGRVTDASGAPLVGATLDVWETAPNGMYEQQDPDQPEMNLRGLFETGADGSYAFRCVRPVPYPIPFDGAAGELLKLMGRHPYRPAHIHFIVRAEGHKSLVTQIFDREGAYLGDDSVFAVKDSLLVDFKPAAADDHAFRVDYDIVLAKAV
jgi:catechol 1,2-dioxygenase